MPKMFDTEAEARAFFADVEVETCDRCGRWTASQADHDEGGIVGPCCINDGADVLFDRICEQCDEEVDLVEEARREATERFL